jgi:hypothetical protein
MSMVTWTLKLEVADGPKPITVTDTMEVEGLDKLEIEVKPGLPLTGVEVQPGDKADIQFVFIQRTSKKPDPRPEPGKCKLSYQINGTGASVQLYDSHMVLGDNVLLLLSDTPRELVFKNEEESPAKVTILVGRRAKYPYSAPQPQPGAQASPNVAISP